jgi:putative ABC transport system permease protein
MIALSNVRAMWRRFVGLTALLAIAVAVCVTAFAISGSAARASRQKVQEGSANRTITVEHLSDRADSPPLGDTAVATLRTMAHVTAVEPRAQASFGYKDAQIPGVLLYATTVRSSLAPPIVSGTRAAVFPLHAGEAVLPTSSQGSDLTGLLGRTITVDITRSTAGGQGTGATGTVTVAGFFDPGWQLDGPDAAYADTATVVTWAAARAGVSAEQYTRNIGYDRASVVVDRAANVPAALQDVQAAGFAASTLQQELSALPGVLALIRTTGKLLLVVLGLVALVGALVVTGALSRQRAREIGILKAVGFRSAAVLRMLITETVVIGAAGALAGIVLGIGGAAAAAAALRTSPGLAPFLPGAVPLPSPLVLGALVVLTVVVTVVGALVPAVRAARMAPTDAIKEW